MKKSSLEEQNEPPSTETPQAEAATEKNVVAPAAERIAALMSDMGAMRPQLLAILDFCREEHTSAEIDDMLEPLRTLRQSVYTPINLRTLLERAGGLTYTSHDEAPEEVTDEDGNLVVPEASIATWLSTDEGIAYCEAQDPFADLVHALDDDEAPLEVFVHILTFCAEEPRSISQIEHSVASTGMLEGDKHQPGYFVGKLEDIGALEWRRAWTIADLGRQYLELTVTDEQQD
jgi:hypothetical protein